MCAKIENIVKNKIPPIFGGFLKKKNFNAINHENMIKIFLKNNFLKIGILNFVKINLILV